MCVGERGWWLYQSSAEQMSVGARDNNGLVVVVVEVSEQRAAEGLASQPGKITRGVQECSSGQREAIPE